MDAEIERLLEALRDSGQEENTVVIFTSDHGDGHGAHRWNQKTILYEEEVRVPLIVNWPGSTRAGHADSTHLVSTGLDLIPTMCDYAGIEPPAELRGRSIRPLAEGVVPDSWRSSLAVETALLFGSGDAAIPGRMLRSPRFKYVAYAEGKLREQLFDLENDPGEMQNLAVESGWEDTRQEHRSLLADWCRENHDPALELFLGLWPKSAEDEKLPRTAWRRQKDVAAAAEVIEWLALISGRRPSELNRQHFSAYGIEEVLDTCFEGSVERAVQFRYPGTEWTGCV